jgi:perosamine synthetase
METRSKSTIPLYKVSMPTGTAEIISNVLATEQVAKGTNVDKFEKLLGEYLGNTLVTSTGDISTSLSICLYLANVRPGDDVLMSPLVCLSTSCPVKNLFANIVWCDVDPLTGNIDPKDVVKRITPRTKAIVVYHWAGNPVDLDEIYAVAGAYNLSVIEDAGEALGAQYHGKKIGATKSNFTVFSFYPNRHLTTIDGAAISFANKDDYEKARWLKRYGIHQPSFRDSDGEINPTSDIPVPGWNTYMNNITAGIGVSQMSGIRDIIDRYQQNGLYYDNALSDIAGITTLHRPDDSLSAYWAYTFIADNRDHLFKALREEGIYASKIHLRNDLYSGFGDGPRELPGVAEFSAHCISIPCGWWVSEENLEYIVQVIKSKI